MSEIRAVPLGKLGVGILLRH